MYKRAYISASFNPVSDTDYQRVADKIKSVLDGEGNGVEVAVTATVTQPTEVTFRPQNTVGLYRVTPKEDRA